MLKKRIKKQCWIFTLNAILLIAPNTLLVAENEIETNNAAALNKQFQKVVSLPFGVCDDNMKNTIKNILNGNEVQAVDYALTNISYKNADLDRACLRIISALEKETLSEFKRRFASGQEISPLMRRTLWLWGASTTIYEGFCLAIDENINHTEQGEDTTRESIGIPLRLCDLAYDLALDRIQNAGDLFGTHRQKGRNTNPLTSRYKISSRDETIAVFKTWWKENKDYLEWSAEKKKFVVNQEAKKAGIPVSK